jgi:hypothetical protein
MEWELENTVLKCREGNKVSRKQKQAVFFISDQSLCQALYGPLQEVLVTTYGLYFLWNEGNRKYSLTITWGGVSFL